MFILNVNLLPEELVWFENGSKQKGGEAFLWNDCKTIQTKKNILQSLFKIIFPISNIRLIIINLIKRVLTINILIRIY